MPQARDVGLQLDPTILRRPEGDAKGTGVQTGNARNNVETRRLVDMPAGHGSGARFGQPITDRVRAGVHPVVAEAQGGAGRRAMGQQEVARQEGTSPDIDLVPRQRHDQDSPNRILTR